MPRALISQTWMDSAFGRLGVNSKCDVCAKLTVLKLKKNSSELIVFFLIRKVFCFTDNVKLENYISIIFDISKLYMN